MAKRATSDPRIDAYIERAADFAKPILEEFRRRVHKAVPGVEETIKWGVPFFLVDGRFLAGISSFKHHAKTAVWDRATAKFKTLDVSRVEELPSFAALSKQLVAAAKIARSSSSFWPSPSRAKKSRSAKRKQKQKAKKKS